MKTRQINFYANSQALTSGTVAMYTWQNTGAQFDNVLVRNLSVPLASATPFSLPTNLMAMLATEHSKPQPGPEPEPPRKREPLLAALTPQSRVSIEGGVR